MDNANVNRKRKRETKEKYSCVLKDSELAASVLGFESASASASDHSYKRQMIDESLKYITNSRDALCSCGRVSDYKVLNKIGRGAYGTVYRARAEGTGEVVAMKEEFDGMSVPTLREIDILRLLPHHRNIVEFREVAADESDGVWVVMEYVKYDLRRYMSGPAAMQPWNVVKGMMRQLLEGVKFLHRNKIMHRDIKSSNILVNSEGVLKICDFGLSRRMDAVAGEYSTKVGTGLYRAPEVLAGEKKYTEAVDMWAVGCVMAEMLLWCDGGAYEEKAEKRLGMVCKVLEVEGNKGYDILRSVFFPPALLTDVGFSLLRLLLNRDPNQRSTAEAASTHLWFEEMDP